MKIALLVPVFITGGGEVMVQRLAVHLKARGADVEVISVYAPQNTPLEEAVRQGNVPLHFLGKGQGKDPAVFLRMWKALDEIRPQVIHGHLRSTFYALPWALAHGVPVLHTIHARPDREFTAKQRKLLDTLWRLGKLHFGAISEKNRDLVAQHYGIEPENVPWVNNPVETRRYTHEDRGDDSVVYMNVGRQDANKNQALILRALPRVLEEVPGARLELLGAGPKQEQLKALARELGISQRVIFHGQVTGTENWLKNADIYISSSHSEGLPLSLLEAEAAFLPIIATRVGGVPDIVRENGFLIEDDDADALAEKMITLGRDKALRETMGQASRAIAQEYDADKCAREYLEIYRKLAE